MELFLAIVLGICFGLLFFIPANRFAHHNLETSFLWLFILSVATLATGFIGLNNLVFLGFILLIVFTTIGRKIKKHMKNSNRVVYAKCYKLWLYVFCTIMATITAFLFYADKLV